MESGRNPLHTYRPHFVLSERYIARIDDDDKLHSGVGDKAVAKTRNSC